MIWVTRQSFVVVIHLSLKGVSDSDNPDRKTRAVLFGSISHSPTPFVLTVSFTTCSRSWGSVCPEFTCRLGVVRPQRPVRFAPRRCDRADGGGQRYVR